MDSTRDNSIASQILDMSQTTAARNLLSSTDKVTERISFWCLALFNTFPFVLFVTSAEDLVPGHAGVVLFCTVFPGLLTKICCSIHGHVVPFLTRAIIVTSVSFLCTLAVAFASSTSTKLLAVIIQSTSGSLGDVTFLALTCHFSDSSVSAYASGSGAAGLVGSGFYYFMRDVADLSQRTVFMIASSFSLLILVSFLSLPRNPDHDGYEIFNSNQADFESEKDELSEMEPNQITRMQFLPVLVKKYMTPFVLVFFFEYLINSGVLPTWTRFRDGVHHDQSKTYALLIFVYQIGVFLSRSTLELIHVPFLSVMTVLQIINLVFFIICSIYELLPSLYIAIVLVAYEGMLGGLTYVNTFHRIRIETPKHLAEWAMALVSSGDIIGIGSASVVAIWLEQAILQSRQT